MSEKAKERGGKGRGGTDGFDLKLMTLYYISDGKRVVYSVRTEAAAFSY